MAIDATAPYDDTNVFARILRGELPCRKVYEDDHVLAFHDINPLAPVHILVIPKGSYVSWDDFSERGSAEEITAFVRAVGRIAREQGLEPLADALLADPTLDPQETAAAYVTGTGEGQVPDAAAALESPPQAQDEPRATAQAQQGQAAQPAAPLSTLIPQAQTYLGTLPCFNPGMQCTAQRITVTLAPNHRWRARSAYLDQSRASGSPMTDQGCWREIPDHPPRILVLEGNGNVRADLALVGNALRVLAVNGQSPNLSYSLTRQPDLDPIDELAKEALPDCD